MGMAYVIRKTFLVKIIMRPRTQKMSAVCPACVLLKNKRCGTPGTPMQMRPVARAF